MHPGTGSGPVTRSAERSISRGARSRRAVAALVSLAVAVPLGVGALSAPARAEGFASGSGAEPAERESVEPVAPDLAAPTREERAQQEAVSAARAAGRRVEATELRTETRTVYAEPDGQMVAELSSSPIRARAKDGTWRKIDTDLSTGEDGLLRPAATPVRLVFSAGGSSGELARMEQGGAALGLEPAENLPAPSLDGATATYEDVRPGVDLQVVAYSYGFSTRLVVRDRAAAEALIAEPFRLGLSGGDGDDVEPRDGGFTIRTAKGSGAISAPPARGADADGRPVAVDADAKPDSADLTLADDALDGDTEFPVTILRDHTADKYGWATVLSGLPDFKGWNTSGEPPLAQVGRCWSGWGACGMRNVGVAWTYWRFDTSFLAGKEVVNADLNAVVEHSPDCNATARYHHVHKATSDPGSSTTWRTKPGWETSYVDMLVPKVNADHGCGGAKTAAADVTSRVNRGGHTSFLVSPANDADVEHSPWWRKYNNNAKLITTYNTVPNAPSGLVTDPPLRTPCTWCAGVPYISDSSVSIKATLTDPDNDALRSVWRYTSNGQTTDYVSPNAAQSGTVHSRPITTAEGAVNTVTWQVNGRDWHNDGPVRAGPRFVVDRQAPTAPVVDNYLYTDENRWHGGVGVEGRFGFRTCTAALAAAGRCTTPAGDDDVDHYLWGWGSATNKVDADALGGNATLWTTPPGDGPRPFVVQAVDRAGNKSPLVTQHLRVRPGNGAYADWSLDGTGKDRAYLGDRDMVLHDGASYDDGAINQGLLLDGTRGHASAPNAVRTDASFSVSAWVRLDDATGARAAVSQDGTKFSGFVLWQRPDEDGDAQDDGGRWAFGMACSDDEYKGTSIADSTEPSETGVPTHLTGTYDARTRKLTLYVDGEKAGEVTRGSACPDWDANGDVQIGRTMWNGAAARDHWEGMVDEVRLYERTLTPAEVRAAVSGANVQVAQWKFEDKPGSRTTLNSVPGGQAGVLHQDAYLCGDCDADGEQDPSVSEGAVGQAVHVGGADGEVVSSDGPVVTTNRSYSVGGHFRLDAAAVADLAVGDRVVALSQDGTERSGFTVSYVKTGATAGQWEYATYGEDVQDEAADAVIRADAADPTAWTHLFAVHDGANGVIRLYVNGSPAGTPDDRPYTEFAASGSFVMGRELNGTPSSRWTGAVDEVRAFTRALSADEVQGMVMRDDVAVGRWPLDGDATSATGHALDGTVHCDGTTTVASCQWGPGQSDLPSDLNGSDRALTGNGNDWISAPHAVDTTESFAVTAWARMDDLNGTSTIVSQDGRSMSAFQLVKLSNGRWGFQRPSVDGAGTSYLVEGPLAQADAWTHLAGVYDAVARTITLYVNGEAAGTAAAPIVWDHPTGGLQIGASLNNGNRQNRVLGSVDDVAAYGRALFPDEVRDLAGRDLTLRHNWRLDEGQGTSAADAVGGSAAAAPGAAQVGWTDGVVGNALRLDGVDDYLSASASDLDLRTDGSFTVSAVVQIDRTEGCVRADWQDDGPFPGPGECVQTALSLDGASGSDSRIRLGYQGGVDSVHENGDWVFEMSNQDRTQVAEVEMFRCDPNTPGGPCDFDRPVHLTGIFHAPTGRIWLFVDGTRSRGVEGVEAWHTPGDLQIGRGRDDSGDPAEYFPGVVDDVRAYSGAFNDARVEELYDFYASGGLLEPVPPAPPKPTHQWKLDEADGTAVAVDSVGGLDATMHNGAAADVIGGRQGRSRTFDGVDSYAVTDGPAVDTEGAFAISAWVYPRSPGDSTSWEVVVGSGGSFVLTRTGNRWGGVAAWAGADGKTVTQSVYSDETVRVGHWTHLALGYLPNLGQMRLYVNGRMSALVSGIDAVAAADVLRIGAHHDLSLPFNGHVDDVRTFGEGLSDAEVAAVYNDVWDPSMGRWTFDDDTVADSSWRNNTTSAHGAVGFVDGRFGRALSVDAGTPGFAQGTYSGAPTYGSITVAARVRVAESEGVQTVASQDGTRMSDFSLQYDGNIGRWSFGGWTTDADSSTFARAYSGPPAAIGKWTHVVGVYDHPAKQLRLYLDGALVGVQDGVTLSAAQRRMAIGRGQLRAANAEFFTGDIDQVDTWMGALSAPEIADLAAQAGSTARTEGDES